jgi:hypothetical protein
MYIVLTADKIHLQYMFRIFKTLVFIVYQFTVHNNYSECPPLESVCIWTVAFFKRSQAAADGLTSIKKVLMKCLFIFSSSSNALGCLNVPADKNLKDCGQHIVRVYCEISVWTSLI